MKNLILTSKQIHEIYELSYSISESRGKKRQEIINHNVIDALKLLENYRECEFRTEVRVKEITYGEYFTVDIQVFKNGKLVEILLLKAPASNVNQNDVNSKNARCGEVLRLAPLIRRGVKLTFICLLPNTTPFFTIDGNIKHFEKTKIGSISEIKKYINVDFLDVTITFDIQNIETCKNKTEVKNIFIKDQIITNIKTHIR